MILTLLNPDTADLEKSYLSNPYAVATTSLQVKNADRFALNDRLMIGEMGQEKTEVVTCTAPATDGSTITINGTVFSHEADTPVYRLRFDQVKFYRSTTGITGAYSVISTQNLDVDNANLQTLYDDTTGLSTYYYKMTVYHSISTTESAFTDPIPGGGFARNQVGRVIDELLREVGDTTEQHVTRSEVLGYFNDVNDDLTINAARPYEFLKTRSALTPVAAQAYLPYPTDSLGNQTMWKFDHMDYNYVDSTTSPTTNITYTLDVVEQTYFRNEFQDNTNNSTTQRDTIHKMSLDDSVNRFRFEAPFLTAHSTLYLHYYQFFPVLDTEGDLLITPTPKIYKLYTKWMYYNKRAIIEPSFADIAKGWQQQYVLEKVNYSKHNRKDVGTPRSFRVRDSVDKSFRIR